VYFDQFNMYQIRMTFIDVIKYKFDCYVFDMDLIWI